MSGFQFGLEAFLTGLLIFTIIHALRLERALGVLRRDRAALEELIGGFNDSTRQAEGGIERLRAVADGVGRQIARHVDQATTLKNDLAFLTERGDKLADQLDRLVRQAQPPSQSMALAQAAGPRSLSLQAASVETVETDGRVRSQAERELLRALRMAR